MRVALQDEKWVVEIDPGEQLDPWLWVPLVKERALWTCERCGGKDCKLDAHHVDGDHFNNCLENGQCLCGSCHAHITHAGKIVSEEARVNISIAARNRVAQPFRNRSFQAELSARPGSGVKNKTKEERSAIALRGWETRRATS